MDSIEAISIVAKNLTTTGRAALSHLPSHRIWVEQLYRSWSKVSEEIDAIHSSLSRLISMPGNLQDDAHDLEISNFCKIIPQMLTHQSLMTKRLLRAIDLVPASTKGDEGMGRSFDEFSDLVTTIRQFIDSTVQTSFQLFRLEARELNFAVLNSLQSFLTFAPDSLHVSFMNDDLVMLINEYDDLTWKERKNSTFSGTRYERFGAKVDLLSSSLPDGIDKSLKEVIKAMFRFSSEFTHAGYVSTLITSSDEEGLFLGSEDDCFFASKENFAELEFRLFKTCTAALADIYLSSLKLLTERLLPPEGQTQLVGQIDAAINALHKPWKATGWEKMFLFVSAPAVRNGDVVRIKCFCGQTWNWKKPHHNWDLFCTGCGTTFRPVPICSDFGYVVTATGPADVFGSPQPIIDDLTPGERGHIYEIWKEFREASEVAAYKGREEIPIIYIRSVSSFNRTMPPLKHEKLYTFIGERSLLEGAGVPIHCNCTYVTLLLPPLKLEEIECWACKSIIKLWALSNAERKSGSNYIIGFPPGRGRALFDVQGGYHRKSWELSVDEYSQMLLKASQDPITSSTTMLSNGHF